MCESRVIPSDGTIPVRTLRYLDTIDGDTDMPKKKRITRPTPIVCSHCGGLYVTTRCKCRAPERRQIDNRKGGRSWRDLRQRKLALDPVCEDCDANDIIGVAATEVHHIVPVSVDPSREFDFSNLCSLCKECHNRRHSGRNGAHFLY